MRDYFLRRLLLVPVTLFGITLLVFTMTRFLPGGPIDKAQEKAMATEGQRSASTRGNNSSLSAEQLDELKATFYFDKPTHIGYLMWLGVLKSEVDRTHVEFEPGEKEKEITLIHSDGKKFISVQALARKTGPAAYSLNSKDPNQPVPEGWFIRDNPPDEEDKKIIKDDGNSHALVHRQAYRGILQWEFNNSLLYGDDVWDMIKARLHISLFYGLITITLTYGLCVPLGIVKALKHRTFVDTFSSLIIFTGYAIPGYVLALILLFTLGFRLEWFPLGGFTSTNFEELSLAGKVLDLASHAVLPVTAYMVGAFAFDTMLMKNNLMDNLAADYVRTAVAKGASFRISVLKHALRNSLIPIAATFGNNLGAIMGGSFLIENIFDINGFGLLGLNSMIGRDYQVVMAIIFLSSLLYLLGNILSDLIVALLDPRIRFK